MVRPFGQYVFLDHEDVSSNKNGKKKVKREKPFLGLLTKILKTTNASKSMQLKLQIHAKVGFQGYESSLILFIL